MDIYSYFVIGISFLIFLAVSIFGNIQFAGMDSGVLVNSAYQGLIGYKPYVDIITATPPVFLIGSKLAFQLFGVRWLSLVLICGLFSSLTFLLHIIILRRYGLNKWLSILLALYIQSMTQIVISFWNYNRVTIVLVALFISAIFLFYKNSKSILNQLILVLLTSIIFLIKINFIPVIILLIIILFVKPNDYSRKRLLGLLLFGLLLSYSILMLNNINVINVIENYILASSRALSLNNWLFFIFSNVNWEIKETLILSMPAFLSFGIVFINNIRSGKFKINDLVFNSIIFVTLVGGVIALGTNNDYRMTSGSLLILGLFFFVQKYGNKSMVTIFSLTLIFFILSGIYKGYTRYNLQESSQELTYSGMAVYFDSNTSLRPLINIKKYPFFNEMLASKRLYGTLEHSDTIFKLIKKYDADINQSIFIGPRVDYLYAMYNIPPPRGLPLWWEVYMKEESKETQRMIKKFIDYKFKVAVFYINDYTFLPQNLVSYLQSNYDTYDYEFLTVHVLKNDRSLDKFRNETSKLTQP